MNHCKGCLTYKKWIDDDIEDDPDAIYCSKVEKNHDGSCPCTLCIIKGMCMETCDARYIYSEEYKPWREIKNG